MAMVLLHFSKCGGTQYLETTGSSNPSELPVGSGNPPDDDPQVFFGTAGVLLMSHTPVNLDLIAAVEEYDLLVYNIALGMDAPSPTAICAPRSPATPNGGPFHFPSCVE
ncbi:hypothetical protein NEOLEDRAFT_1175619 [Neolentinus lepideus HHB14362 ss-1]|uniref:Uncharacterized protein n=1 Tax=Neolentinus lepideus HHB14362 ss-1 TaxID=1314782 RepID=A0A165UVR2_9AGAM|nr:hypothetical protein NEOLEDRAFT_1175619 [Neolentinus lepideus HHB14362 ss-1]